MHLLDLIVRFFFNSDLPDNQQPTKRTKNLHSFFDNQFHSDVLRNMEEKIDQFHFIKMQ